MAQTNNLFVPQERKPPAVKVGFCQLRLKELLTILIGTAIPVAIGVYTTVTNGQMQKSAKLAADEQHRISDERRAFDLKQATKSYQEQLYKTFLDDMYKLYKDGELNDSADPWVFANARYQAVHREWDAFRKEQVLQFLKKQQMIGRQKCTTGCEITNVEDIIRLNGLNFDDVRLTSQTDNLKKLDLSCVSFDQISMVNATISYANFNGVTFVNSRLNGTIFHDVSFHCAAFYGTDLDGTDFGNSNLEGARFINVDLSTAKLTPEQKQQAIFAG
jgi:hypothetical protein